MAYMPTESYDDDLLNLEEEVYDDPNEAVADAQEFANAHDATVYVFKDADGYGISGVKDDMEGNEQELYFTATPS